MIAPEPKLVRRLQQRVRAVVASNPALTRDRRRGPRRWPPKTILVLAGLAAPMLIFGAITRPNFHSVGLLLMAWTAITTLGPYNQATNGLGLNSQALAQRELWGFYVLPVKNEAAFHHQWRLIYCGPFLIVTDWLAFGLAHAWRDGSAVAWCAAPVFALAQWICALALGVHMARAMPRASQTAGGLLGLLTLFMSAILLLGPVALYFSLVLKSTATAKQVLALMHHFTPAGWLLDAHVSAAAGKATGWVAGFAAIGGGWLLLQLGKKQLRNDFSLERIMGYEGTAKPELGKLRWIGAEEDANAPVEEPLLIAEPPPAVDMVVLRARLGEVLNAPSGLALFRRGWLESVATHALPERQRVLVDLLQPGGMRAANGWKTAFVLIAIAQAVRLAGLDPTHAAMLTAFALGYFLLPTFGGHWSGLANKVTQQGTIGFSAFFPVGLGEVARVLLTVNAVRTVAAFPVLVVAMRYGFTVAPLPWTEALGFALRTLVVVLALQPVWAMVAFSKCSNDSSAPGWWMKLLLLGLIAGLLTLSVVGVAMFFVQSGGKALFCAAVLLGFSHALLALYGWAWGRNCFDLVARPQGR